MNMIEKIARVIQGLEGCSVDNCNHCKEIAKAAITAMREPTNDMANEYFKLRKEVGDINATACFNVSVWETMIDAALKDVS